MSIEDDKREIMDAVKRAMATAMDHHKLTCPVEGMKSDLVRIKKDLYNGDDKPGFVEEVKGFIIRQDQRAIDDTKRLAAEKEALAVLAEKDAIRRKNTQWRAGIVAAATLALLGFLGNKAWDQITILQRLEDDWTRYYQTPPATPPVPLTAPPAPKVEHRSFFAHPGPTAHRDAPQNATLPATFEK